MIIKNQKSFILFILFKNNNILLILTTLNKKIIFWKTIGSEKFNGAKKITLISLKLSLKTILNYPKNIHIKVKGFNKYKRLILKYLIKNQKIILLSFCDLTAIPHNGCKKSKNRRI